MSCLPCYYMLSNIAIICISYGMWSIEDTQMYFLFLSKHLGKYCIIECEKHDTVLFSCSMYYSIYACLSTQQIGVFFSPSNTLRQDNFNRFSFIRVFLLVSFFFITTYILYFVLEINSSSAQNDAN